MVIQKSRNNFIKLGAKLAILLQGNETIAFAVLISIKQKLFASLSEENVQIWMNKLTLVNEFC